MKILHVDIFFNEELLYFNNYVSREQYAAGHEVAVLTGALVKKVWRTFVDDPDPEPGVTEVDGVAIHRLPIFGPVNKPFVSPQSIRSTIEAFRPDIVHFYGLSQILSGQTLAVLKRHYPEVPVVINDHSNPTRAFPGVAGRLFYGFWTAMNRRFDRQIRAVVAPNEASRALLEGRFPYFADRLRIIPLGYDGRRFHPGAGPRNDDDRLVVGFAGKIDPAKQVDRLIRVVAAAGLVDEARCIVAGASGDPEYEASLQDLANDLGVEVEWRPFLTPPELAALYAYVDVACFPGSISITTIEATGCGAPALVYESITGLEDRVADGRGSLFRTDEELGRLLCEKVAEKQAGEIDYDAVAEATRSQSWQEIGKSYQELYDEVLSQATLPA